MAGVYTNRRRIGHVSEGAIRRIVEDELNEDLESKRTDREHQQGVITSATSLDYIPFFAPLGGTEINQRLGLQVKVKYILIRATFRIGVAANPPRQFVRFRVLVDTMYSGDAADRPVVSGNVNATHLANANTIQRIIMPREVATLSRYLILVDDVIRLDTGNNTIMMKEYMIRKFRGVCHFTGYGDTLVDFQRNSLWFHFMTDATANGPEVGAVFTTVYTDA